MSPDSSRLRLGILGVVVISLFAALLARLWYLQVLAAPDLRLEADRNSIRLIATEAPRGRILDAKGRVLVGNGVTDTVVVGREEVKRHPDLLPRLAALLGIPEAQIQDRLADERFTLFKPVPVADDVPKDKLIHIREHQAEFPGVDVVQRTRRIYPEGTLAAHVLGYTGQINDRELAKRKDAGYKAGDTIGKAGVEAAYEADLRGLPEMEKLEVDSRGRVLRTLGLQPAVQGRDVQLNLDIDVQRVLEESLARRLEARRHGVDPAQPDKTTVPGGAAVVLDPRTGGVVAMASYPTYDPREFIDGIRVERFRELQDPIGAFPLNDRAIQGLYAPGSTFKLVSGLAALRTGLIPPQHTINDQGSIRVGNPPRTFRNAGGQVNGLVDMRRALALSSDVFFYRIGADFWTSRQRFGNAIQDTARDLGMGSPTGIELPNEAGGRVPDPDMRRRMHEENPQAFPTGSWFTGDNMNLAIGQGELVVTPMQLATAYATFANGGTVYAPRVASAIVDAGQHPVRRIEPNPVRTIELPPAVRSVMLEGFKGAVVDPKGTAHPAFGGFPLASFPVAGKTGTAEAPPKEDTALFAAFAPADDPRYVVAVVMEESGFGATAAAPVARRVLQVLEGGQPEDVYPTGGVE
ncbi:MAG: penicillin-binding protein 2 [Actinomycetota bacterium]|nr:penicillin-binding protein 2 [Actinomycetota bacterium]